MNRLATLLLLLLPSPVIADTVETYTASAARPVGSQDFSIDLQAFGIVNVTGATYEEAHAAASTAITDAIQRAITIQRESIEREGYEVYSVEVLSEDFTISVTQTGGGWQAHGEWSCVRRYEFGNSFGSTGL